VAVRLAGALGLVLSTAGCPAAPPSADPTNQHRLDVLRVEPIVAEAAGTPGSVRGFHVGPHGETRTRGAVNVQLHPPGAGRDPAAVEAGLRAAVARLRTTGWTISGVYCGAAPPTAPSTPPGALDSADWMVTGYKLVDGVSYGVTVTGAVIRTGAAGPPIVQVRLRAPEASDPADRFTDRPPDAGSASCLDRPPPPPHADLTAGRLLVLADRWPPPVPGDPYR